MTYNASLHEDEKSKFNKARHIAYPSIADQLDMLYHDIKNGNLENGKWIQAIDNVKNSVPKP